MRDDGQEDLQVQDTGQEELQAEAEIVEDEAEPEPRAVPYRRFEEVVRGKQALEAERAVWSRREEALLAQLAQHREPVEAEDDDPVEQQRRELARVRKELEGTRKAIEGKLAKNDIDAAVSSRKFLDPEDTKRRLAELYTLARAMGHSFDAEAEAKRLYERQQAVLKDKKITWAQDKKRAVAETRSLSTAPSPPPADPPVQIPKWGTPERRAWEQEQKRSILAQYRQG
jgi:hypothetical protein